MSWRAIGPAGPPAVASRGRRFGDRPEALLRRRGRRRRLEIGELPVKPGIPVFDKAGVGAIGAVTIDPTNNDTVWVGTGEANPRNDVSYGDGVYKTTDGGDTGRTSA